ncbi:MAG: phytanoyl-CoA dioxygenase family protein [Candidatus Latescibacterota bacterium]|nr:phytanoyl-CoA dioxygenase family protein [Candidatus Latescibacterota bacterium]
MQAPSPNWDGQAVHRYDLSVVESIVLSAAERSAERLSVEHAQRAIAAVREAGVVVLEDAVDEAALDALHERLLTDTHALVAARDRGDSIPGWKRGHLQQKPPHHPPYIFRDVVANPFAIQVTHGVLGDGLFNSFYSGNTNLPGSEVQPLHRDAQPLWPDGDGDHPATTLVVNISPIDVHPDNGSTEIWPGSHRVGGSLTETLIEARRAVAPPVRVQAPKGSVIVRDIRLWHCGVPNASDQIRHMIALVHQVQWFHRTHTLRFQTGCEAEFHSEYLDPNAEFVDAPPDYLFGPHPNHS